MDEGGIASILDIGGLGSLSLALKTLRYGINYALLFEENLFSPRRLEPLLMIISLGDYPISLLVTLLPPVLVGHQRRLHSPTFQGCHLPNLILHTARLSEGSRKIKGVYCSCFNHRKHIAKDEPSLMH